MSTPHKWINDISLYSRLESAILVMCSHKTLEDRLKLSKSLIIPLQIDDFPKEHLREASIVLEEPLYKFIDDINIEITANKQVIDEYAKSLFEII